MGDGPPRGVTVAKRVFSLGLLQNQTESLTNIICEALQPFIPSQPKSKPVVGLWSRTVSRSWTLWPALAWPPPIGSKVPYGSLPNLPPASLRAREPRRLWRRSSHHAVYQYSITRHENRPKYPQLNRTWTKVVMGLSWPFTSRGPQPCRPYCRLVRPGSVTVCNDSVSHVCWNRLRRTPKPCAATVRFGLFIIFTVSVFVFVFSS